MSAACHDAKARGAAAVFFFSSGVDFSFSLATLFSDGEKMQFTTVYSTTQHTTD
jgi:hypothetical protein